MKMRIKTIDLILVALFTALTIVGRIISVPLWPVAVTLQTLFTLLAGIVLGPYLGSLSQLVYMLLGLVGLPVFASNVSGPAAFLTPSFGFVIGFVAMPLVMGLVIRRGSKPSFVRVLLAAVAATVVLYAIGIPYMYVVLTQVLSKDVTVWGVLQMGCIPFIIGDTAKCVLTAVVAVKIVPALAGFRSRA